MSKQKEPGATKLSQQVREMPKTIVAGAVAGGILGALTGYLYKIGVLTIPGLAPIFAPGPIAETATGTLLGIFVVGGIGGLIGLFINQNHSRIWENEQNVNEQDAKLQILEEQLGISKRWMQTGEVTIHKEVLKDEKTIKVPILCENLVIEKKALAEVPNKENGSSETIRIPIKEERFNIIKHPVILNDVSIYKRKFRRSQLVEKTLKKDRVHLEITGDPDIIVKENDKL